MKHVLVALLVVVGASTAFGYMGATVSAIENDNATAGASVFAVPAAAGMAGAQLLFNNSALLNFSTGYEDMANVSFVTMPLVGNGVTIHGVDYAYDGLGTVTAVDDALAGGLFTNRQGTAADPRFPTNIPRVGRYAGMDYTAVQFDLANAAQEVGAFVAMNSNACPLPGAYDDDNNILMQADRIISVAVLGTSDTFETAEYFQVPVGGMYAPFIKVASNGTDPIKAVCFVQDAGTQSGAPFGFFDVYATPEPATMALLALGGLALIRRRA